MAEQFANNARSTLAAAITAAQTTLTVVAFAAFPSTVPFRVVIDSEILRVTAGAGTANWTVTRGAEGTTAAAHVAGAAVDHVVTAGALAAMQAEALVGALPPVGAEGTVLTVVGGLWLPAAPTGGGGGGGGGGGEYPPQLADYAWVTQGAATAVQETAGVRMAIAAGGSDSLHVLQRAVPAGAWQLTVKAVVTMPDNNYASAGIVLREATTSEAIRFGLIHEGARRFQVQPLTNLTTPLAPYASSNAPAATTVYFRIYQDGTTRDFQHSLDGTSWTMLYQHVTGTHLATSHWGLYVEANQAVSSVEALFRSVEIGPP